MPNKALYTTLFIGWVLLITGLSLFDLDPEDKGIEIPYLDKLVHFTFYLVFVILGGIALKYWRIRRKSSKYLTLLIVLAILYGLIIEVLQDLLPVDRSAELLDVLANTIGAITGGLLIKTSLSRAQALK